MRLSPQQTKAWRGFLDTHAHIASEMEETLHKSGLSLSEYRALLLLEEAGAAGEAMTAVSAALGMSCSGFTRMARRLEKAGYASGSCSPDDGRVTLLAISAAGQRALNEARKSYYDRVDDLFWSNLSDEELDQLSAIWARFPA